MTARDVNAHDILAHYGTKGQKWGVRRYQYIDGSYTPAGRVRYGYGKKSGMAAKAVGSMLNAADNKRAKSARSATELGAVGKDLYLKKNTKLYRVQSRDNFENFAFYATYKKDDVDKYTGMFGKNLKLRANAAAKRAEREGADNAKALREQADGMKIYQLRLASTDKLKVPSESNAGQILNRLRSDKAFNDDLTQAIANAESNMHRPQQQMLFKEAERYMAKDPSGLSDRQKRVIYRAANLSLTNHNDYDIRVQDRLYGSLKTYGYSALLDLNDKSYSSYRAKSPVIVFDTTKVQLQACSRLDQKKIDKLYRKYSYEIGKKESTEYPFGLTARVLGNTVDKAKDAVRTRMERYLRG